MYIKIKEIEDALEAAYIRSVLNEKNIPYNITEYTDSAYKGFLETKYGYGILEAHIEFKDQILQLLKEERLSDEELHYESINSDDQKKSSFNPSTSKIILAILIVSNIVFAFLYFKSRNELTYINTNGIFSYEWNDKTSSIITKWKKDGKQNYVQVDNNRNYIAEKRFAYDLDENIMEEAYDKNEDGVFEKIITYDINGKIADIYYDIDNNYILDKSESKINNDLSIIFENENNDSIWESVSFADNKGLIKKKMTYTEYQNFLIELSKN